MKEVKVSDLVKTLHKLTAKSVVFCLVPTDVIFNKNVFFDVNAILLPVYQSDALLPICKNIFFYFKNSSHSDNNFLNVNSPLYEGNRHSLLILFEPEIATEFIIQQHVEIRNENSSINANCDIQEFILRDYIAQMADWINSQINVSKPVITHKFKELLLILWRQFSIDFFKFLQEKNTHITNIQTIIETHVSKNISVEELARKTHKSLSTFKREFDKVYGMPPGTYIRKKRLEAAAKSLLLGKMPSEIYEDFGYETVSNFIYAFKKHFNKTPKEFIRESLS